MEPYWADTNGHSVKYESEAAVSSFPYCTESSLNFSTSATAYSEDDAEYATGRRNKASRQDPLSHRIIEKRRRDRMNSCLADLSRLIPPQYQRKGRGRIEKTEIIEMAIRHLKHLQGECLQKDNDYRQGYSDCMKEAAKFLYDSQMQDFCYRMIARLQEHCDEIMKNDCFKARCHGSDNVSASSGSPHNVYHPAAPLSQLRDILASDIEHSNDHNDVKDLSFRNHWNHLNRDEATTIGTSEVLSVCSRDNSSGTTTSSVNNNNCKQSPQAHRSVQAMSTASASAPQQQHTDSSNHDFDSSHEPVLPHETTSMHSPPLSHNHHHHHHHLFHNSMHHPVNGLLMQASRMRNYSESSHDIEHNNNYKYKNHIKERFNQDVHLHDEETSSEHGIAPPDLLASEHSHTHSMSDHSKDGDAELDALPRILLTKKRKLTENKTSSPLVAADVKPLTFTDIKAEISATKPNNNTNDNLAIAITKLQTSVKHPNNSCISSMGTCKSFSVPIFALHGHGTYYVPLNVDYNSLIPFLNGIDLLDKSYASMSVVHPISINVNFTPITVPSTFNQVASTAAANLKNKPPPPTSSMTAFAIASSTTPLSVAPTTVLSALTTKPKMEPFTNGCYSLGSYA